MVPFNFVLQDFAESQINSHPMIDNWQGFPDYARFFFFLNYAMLAMLHFSVIMLLTECLNYARLPW